MTSRTLLVSTCVLVASVLLAGGAAAVPPVVSLTSPEDESATNDATPSFEGSGGTAVGDTEVTVKVWSGLDTTAPPVRSLTALVDPDSGAWEVIPGEALLEGSYTAKAEQADVDGNIGESSLATFTIDLSAPTVTLTSPANGSATSDDTPTFAGGVGTAPGDVDDITLEIWTGTELVQSFPATVDTNTWSATAEALPDGSYTALARQADAVGNSGQSTASFAVDTTPPVFAAVGASQVIEQTAPAGAVATYGPPATDELDPAPKVACSPPSGAVFPVGVTTVTCSATDWAGNSAETQLSVTVVNTIRPAGVQGLRVQTGNRRVGLTWRNPGDWDFDRVVIRRTLRGASAWQVVYQGSGTAFTDRGVVNDTEYLYETVSYDGAGNASASVSTGARPSAFFAPIWNATLKRPPTLRWAAARKAAYYNVQLWRNGRKILSRWPGDPRFLLQKTWRDQGRRYSLRDGTYFAYAWPGFGPRTAGRYGRLIGWTKFRVS